MVMAMALLAMAAVLAGCEASVSTSSQKDQLEKIISDQLPGKLAGQVKDPKVTSVSCTKTSSGQYDCSAKLTYTAKGATRTATLAIAGTCTDKQCSWKTTN
jgi:hypothetical protein